MKKSLRIDVVETGLSLEATMHRAITGKTSVGQRARRLKVLATRSQSGLAVSTSLRRKSAEQQMLV